MMKHSPRLECLCRARQRCALVWCAIVLVPGPVFAQTGIHVTRIGSANPDGNASHPFHMVESGVRHAECTPGSTINIAAGTYRETFVTGTPCLLTAAGGTATIGDLSAAASTTLSVVTLNTHLFGDDVGPSWLDQPRAEDIAQQLNGSGFDVVGFQEIWDEDLFWGGDGQGSGIRANAGYPSAVHGSANGFFNACFPVLLTALNSGLAVMSLHAFTDASQHSYGDTCQGCLPTDCSPDCLASKGWVLYRFTKDGFDIAFFNTHTQSGTGGDETDTRVDQMGMLASAVQSLRQVSPGTSAFVIGDMNIVGEGTEYISTLVASFGPLGGHDGDRNAPGFNCDGTPIHTLSSGNELAQWFEDDLDFGCGGQVTNQRLDYIFYFPPLDGSVDIIPRDVAVMPFRGPEHCVDAGFCSDESSDHFGVFGTFDLYRLH